MPRRRIRVTGAPGAPLRAALAALRTAPGMPGGFPPEVLAEAERAARDPALPLEALAARATHAAREDATDVPFFTLSRPGAATLGRALHLSRRGTGHRVRYAVADVAAFVVPSGPVDAETHRRVTTLCLPDGNVPLHPAVLGEGAASLLPGRTRPAVLWTLDLDADGRVLAVDVRRALVRSRARLDPAGVQHAIDAGTAEEPLVLVAEVGRLREGLEAERGGISLTVPEQEITVYGSAYRVAYRAAPPVERRYAQLSLLPGMAAAELMLRQGTGVLCTLPAAPDGAVGRLRRTAHALRVDWPHHVSYAALVRSLDPHRPPHAAFLQECTTLLRGAGHTVFRDGRLPELTTHAAVAAPYAHCAAPLHRLADRYATEICLAAAAGQDPPDWVLAALDALPAETAEGARRAEAVERACLRVLEAALLADRTGDVFDACVIDVEERHPTTGTVQLASPPVLAPVESPGTPLPLGEDLRVRLTRADPVTATLCFTPA
ncbi:RNB domain-containing ribonuclease [Streptomyces sp. NPDC005526]|uniref:RNB domain-containing ribonuclease n=1 Tax=Streptomyces sp. NPDC005526 TaxID=3156885 RepID=UPI0033A7FE82